jgi:hypothetical protein
MTGATSKQVTKRDPAVSRGWRWLFALLGLLVAVFVTWHLARRSFASEQRKARPQAQCEYDKECKKPVPICDQSAGRCVQCLSNTDCGEDSFCSETRCVPDVCPPGRFCSRNAVVDCSDSGDRITVVQPCGTETCLEADGSASCGTRPPVASAPAPAAGSGCRPGVIDDMEQGTEGRIPACEDRFGSWQTFNDQSEGAWQVPAPGGGGAGRPYSPGEREGTHSVRTFGASGVTASAGNTAWGAGIGFELYNPAQKTSVRVPYNAASRGYRGLRFRAKIGPSPRAVSRVTLRIPDRNTDALLKKCTVCYDDYGFEFRMTTSWQTYTVLWTDLVRSGRGVPNLPFDATGITAIQWQFGAGEAYDLWIDDVEFVR